MKFEKFLKNCGARGSVINTKCNGQFLKLGTVMLVIPVGVNVLSVNEVDAPEYIENVFIDFEDDNLRAAELTGAQLPTPDASPSKIQRIFTNNEGGTISIDNKTFGIIERADHLYTFAENQDDEAGAGDQDALVITAGFGDDEHIIGIVFDELFYYDKVTNKNKEDNK